MTAHLDDATFERLAMRELDATARAAALAHVTACPRCAAIARTLLDVEAGAREAKLAGVPVARAPRRWLWASTALAAVAAVAVVWMVRRTPDHAAAVVRGSNAALQLRGDASALVWEPTGATGYRVAVFDANGRLVWTRDVAAPPLRWPAEVPAAPGSYHWKVEALDGNAVTAESPLGSFRIAP